MFELSNKIARLEMCSEQLRLHLRSIPRDYLEAEDVRSDLLMMLLELVELKGERQRLGAELSLGDVPPAARSPELGAQL